MNRTSQFSLFKSLLKHPFRSSSIPTYPFSINSLSSVPAQQRCAHSFLIPKPNLSQLDIDSSPSLKHDHFLRQIPPCLQKTQFIESQKSRNHSTESGAELDYNKEVDTINLKFAEAREEIEMAMESKETVYFDEEAKCAREAVKEVLDLFEGLLGRLKDNQKEALRRSMGLKIEQLKAELKQLDD